MEIKTTYTVTEGDKNNSSSSSALKQLIVKMFDLSYELCSRELQKNFIKLRNEAINAFYGSYSPKYYKRSYSLRYMIYGEINNNIFNVAVGNEVPSYHGHHHVGDEEYIYINSFQHGYHGGAIDGPNHPSPGTPYWRKPYPQYTRWGHAAPSGPSPYDIFKSGWNNFIRSNGQSIYDKAFDQAVQYYGPTIMSYL